MPILFTQTSRILLAMPAPQTTTHLRHSTITQKRTAGGIAPLGSCSLLTHILDSLREITSIRILLCLHHLALLGRGLALLGRRLVLLIIDINGFVAGALLWSGLGLGGGCWVGGVSMCWFGLG